MRIVLNDFFCHACFFPDFHPFAILTAPQHPRLLMNIKIPTSADSCFVSTSGIASGVNQEREGGNMPATSRRDANEPQSG